MMEEKLNNANNGEITPENKKGRDSKRNRQLQHENIHASGK